MSSEKTKGGEEADLGGDGYLPWWNYWSQEFVDWDPHVFAKWSVERLREDQLDFHYFPEPTDFAPWARKASWTVDEAVALNWGKSPSDVSWEGIVERGLEKGPFGTYYGRLRKRVLAAQSAGELPVKMPPEVYMDWVLKEVPQVGFPGELSSALSKRNTDIDELTARCVVLERENVELKTRLETNVRRPSDDANRQKKMLKIILGMAMGGYGYEAHRHKRSPVPGDIAKDVRDKVGGTMDDATVRGYLHDGIDEFFPDKDEPKPNSDSR